MSWQSGALNVYLKTVEKRFLEKISDPGLIRARFERTARLLFHAPFGTKIRSGQIAGRDALFVDRPDPRPLMLYFHGGGYIFGSPRTHAAMLATLAVRANARAVLPQYRLAPEHPFPAAVEDAVSVYKHLLDAGEDPAQIAFGGDSAGGGLALALLGECLRQGLPVPAGLFTFSPLADLTFSGASIRNNAQAEALLPTSRTDDMVRHYLNGRPADDPRASPLFADYAGAPPIWIAVGD